MPRFILLPISLLTVLISRNAVGAGNAPSPSPKHHFSGEISNHFIPSTVHRLQQALLLHPPVSADIPSSSTTPAESPGILPSSSSPPSPTPVSLSPDSAAGPSVNDESGLRSGYQIGSVLSFGLVIAAALAI
ncbi:RNA-binding family protein isoform 1 [Hibiscus syriacus]|uniref:RNA-binding family protein isoform 1 n=1 Tax=Hibiscus syriacus TaxID=106335 RepID=A0A6A2ZG13_HIBSY|nr:uncharacterized protein LOC120146196 [Hibiscus syriacus]KAE8690279.1 RNA-binding family protein isoform 1 [Hibiscus syriacus]